MSTVVLKELDEVSLKNSGYIKQKQKDMFTVRLRVPCGNVTSEQLIGIGHIAKQFGGGYVHITTRQGVQIPNVNVNDLDDISEELQFNCTPPGSSGPHVRNIIACPGNHECTSGIIDTYSLGGMLDGEFFKEKMLVKIKFAITGCPNGCAKPQANDFGVMGIIKCTSIRKSAQVAVYVLIHVRIKLLSWKVKKQALSGIGASYVVNV